TIALAASGRMKTHVATLKARPTAFMIPPSLEVSSPPQGRMSSGARAWRVHTSRPRLAQKGSRDQAILKVATSPLHEAAKTASSTPHRCREEAGPQGPASSSSSDRLLHSRPNERGTEA